MRLRERIAPAGGAAADPWSVEAGVRFGVSSNAEERWKYHGDVAGTDVLTPHGFGFSQSWHAEPQRPEPAEATGGPLGKGTAGWSWSYYGGWRDGERHGPAHLLFHDGSFFVGNMSDGVPRRGFFGLPNGSALHVDGTDGSYGNHVCKGPRPVCAAGGIGATTVSGATVLGSQTSLNGHAGLWAARRTQEEISSRPDNAKTSHIECPQVWLYLWAQALPTTNAGQHILRSCQAMAASVDRETNVQLLSAAATTLRRRISWRIPRSDSGPESLVRARPVALSGLLLAAVFVTWLLWQRRLSSRRSVVTSQVRRKQLGAVPRRDTEAVVSGVRRRASKGVQRTESQPLPKQSLAPAQPPKPCSQTASPKVPPATLPPPQQQQPSQPLPSPSLPPPQHQQQPSQSLPSPSVPPGQSSAGQSLAVVKPPVTGLTVKQKVERIKEQLGLEEQLSVGTAVAAALESLGMPQSGCLATQIDAINAQLGLDKLSEEGGHPPSDRPQSLAPPGKPMPPIGPPTNVGTGTAGAHVAVVGSDGHMQTMVRLHVAGIVCGGCRSKVEHTLRAVPAVSRVSVDLGTGQAVCYGSAALRSKLLINALGILGMRGQVIEDENGSTEVGDMGHVSGAEESPILSLMRSLGDAQGNVVKRYKCGELSTLPHTPTRPFIHRSIIDPPRPHPPYPSTILPTNLLNHLSRLRLRRLYLRGGADRRGRCRLRRDARRVVPTAREQSTGFRRPQQG